MDPPSQLLLLSLLSFSYSIARLRSTTRHRQQGCSEGAAQPENGTTTRPVDLSIPSPAVLPSPRFPRVSAEHGLTELPGEWRWVCEPSGRSWVGWLGCSRAVSAADGKPHNPGGPSSRGRSGAERCAARRHKLPLSARLGYKSCIERSGECSSRFSFPSMLALNLYCMYTERQLEMTGDISLSDTEKGFFFSFFNVTNLPLT